MVEHQTSLQVSCYSLVNAVMFIMPHRFSIASIQTSYETTDIGSHIGFIVVVQESSHQS